MLKKILYKIFIIFFAYIIFVILAPDLAIKMDKKLNINFNQKILEIKDKLIFVFSSDEKILKETKENSVK